MQDFTGSDAEALVKEVMPARSRRNGIFPFDDPPQWRAPEIEL